MVINAAKERLCRYTELTNEMVFEENNEQSGSEEDEHDEYEK